ncbi:MAG: bifunctional acetate--CoA ligase family protein/GNAT family N-acetyltransferase [Rhodothermales bacterium]|nr:bifunctional acetate--CoA ligase family protein/GNAT family N-acetyltransferase [Rhodothermales bacterium]
MTTPPGTPSLAELTSRDPSHDVLRHTTRSLQPLFEPRTVAVIGATEKPHTVGRTLVWNLISSPFGGTVFPVNPKRPSILGIKAYPTVADVPAQLDLAVIATPAHTVPGVIRECVAVGVKGAIIISAGFKERGPEGVALEQEVLAEARKGGLRIIGPNCLGVMHPPSGFNATFASATALPGSVGFISQSGALCTSILDWSFQENVGFSAFISVGSMLDVGWGDLIHYLGEDPKTRSIVIYMESIGDPRSFMSAAREVALSKPIIVIKAGRTEEASKAASSHTGALTGSDEVLDAAFRRCGVLRVESIADLFHMAEILSKQPPPKGPRLTIVTNAGGPGVLATDALLVSGGKLATLSDAGLARLNEVLPDTWSHANPIDLIGDASPKRYSDTLAILADEKESDGTLVILSPQAMTSPTDTANAIGALVQASKQPVLASWMGGESIEQGEKLLNAMGIPTFSYPDTAARMFTYMWQHAYRLRALYETPDFPVHPGEAAPASDAAGALIDAVHADGRALLNEYESKQLLAAYGIPTVPTHLAHSADEAVAHAGALGYPVVLKLLSNTITHKTDVGGVQLNLGAEAQVREAYETIRRGVTEKHGAADFQGVTVQPMIPLSGYELIVGSTMDPQFGPVMLFGTGGSLVEVFKDRAIGLPPLNTTLARRIMERTRIDKALNGVRGRPPVDRGALERLMVRFSQLVVEHRRIKEVEINPLLASHERLLALDARVVLHPPGTDLAALPKLAIRPYPQQYVGSWALSDGTPVTIRPIRPEDEPLMVQLHRDLSEESVYFRYLQSLPLAHRTDHSRLARLCFIDYDREIAFVAERLNAETRRPEIFAAARLSRTAQPGESEISILIHDDYQHRGVGSEILRRLLDAGRQEGLQRIVGQTLPENHGMKRLFEKLGFTVKYLQDERIVLAELSL